MRTRVELLLFIRLCLSLFDEKSKKNSLTQALSQRNNRYPRAAELDMLVAV